MPRFAVFFAMLYGMSLAALALWGIVPPPPWFLLLGSVLFLVPLAYLLTRAGLLLAHSAAGASPWLPMVALATGLVLTGVYGRLLATVPIVFTVFLGVVGITFRQGRISFPPTLIASLLIIALGYMSVFALNYLCAILTFDGLRDATLWHIDLTAYRWLLGVEPDGGAIFPLVRNPLLFTYLENAYHFMFAGIPLAVFVLHATGGEVRAFIRALFACYFVALTIFLLFPALGPTMAYPHLFDPAYAHTQTYDLMRQAATEYAALRSKGPFTGIAYFVAFPSLHVAVAVVVQAFLYRSRAHFWLFLPVNALVLPATVLLGHHYLLDLPAGVLLAVAVLAAPALKRAGMLLRWPGGTV